MRRKLRKNHPVEIIKIDDIAGEGYQAAREADFVFYIFDHGGMRAMKKRW